MVDEYISRKAAIAARKRSCDRNCAECDFAIIGDSWCNGEVFVVDLLRIPAADVRPVVRGKWINDRNGRYSASGDNFYCSICKEPSLRAFGKPAKTNYCPNCGADMRPEPPKEKT